MDEERKKAAFNIRELTYLLDGGEKLTLVSCEKKKEHYMQMPFSNL